MTIIPEQKEKRTIVLSWLLFSLAYWTAAFIKPYHAHEFWTFTYVKNCTFLEIIKFKDTGIGHPPLYHLLQKVFQTILPSFHPVYIRLPNYLIGSFFIVLLVRMLKKYNQRQIYYYGISLGATVLYSFIYSRMWGLVSMFSLLLLWVGEKYMLERERGNYLLFEVIFILGVFADYNFVLLAPYACLVRFYHHKRLKPILYLMFTSLLLTWGGALLLKCLFLKKLGIHYYLYSVFANLFDSYFEIGNLIVNFWFLETFLAALLIFFLSVLFSLNRTSQEGEPLSGSCLHHRYIILFFIATASTGAFVRYDLIRTSYAVGMFIIFLIMLLYKIRSFKPFESTCLENRLLMGIVGAMLLLLSINPLFYTSLIEQRFMIILLPFFFLYIYRVCSKATIKIISVIFITSGLLAISSNGVLNLYPAPANPGKYPVVYESVYAYANQYIVNYKMEEKNKPVIINTRNFRTSCRVCAVETSKPTLEAFDTVWVIGEDKASHSEFLPTDFKLTKRIENLTWTDKLQFKFLLPIRSRYFSIFKYRRDQNND